MEYLVNIFLGPQTEKLKINYLNLIRQPWRSLGKKYNRFKGSIYQRLKFIPQKRGIKLGEKLMGRRWRTQRRRFNKKRHNNKNKTDQNNKPKIINNTKKGHNQQKR